MTLTDETRKLCNEYPLKEKFFKSEVVDILGCHDRNLSNAFSEMVKNHELSYTMHNRSYHYYRISDIPYGESRKGKYERKKKEPNRENNLLFGFGGNLCV
ncbi:MAG: hypothetical protein V3T88_07925 [Nitrosomonadaceae bacterium]